ncbi:MAG TPA: sigma-70 family RNA polymerase sigma factor [Verrucomicrobiae bacterium]|nr:sigma-70 family RNA polymerase sigma factor [Verrucomicrobiae bacterium]
MTTEPQQSMDADIRQRLDAEQYYEAFERVVELYGTRVFHLALSMLRNQAQAEDMAQEILLKIWKGLPGYHGGASLSTWIYAIARNTCLTELKKRAARPSVSLDEPEFQNASEALPALQSNDRESGFEIDIEYLLEQLPEKYRQVLTLFYLEEKSYEEVSALLGLPLGTVKTFLFRAKKQLLKNSLRCEAKRALDLSSQAGPARLGDSFSRPSRTKAISQPRPNAEALGYSQSSRRDENKTLSAAGDPTSSLKYFDYERSTI